MGGYNFFLVVFREVNVDATRHLLEQAAKAGVKKFVYVSPCVTDSLIWFM